MTAPTIRRMLCCVIGPPVVATLVGQRTGSTEYLCDGDEAKEKENNPNHFIAFEYALNKSMLAN